MNPSVNELVRSVIDKQSLDECSLEELQQLVQQYPYFGAAQFLLSKKMKDAGSPQAEKQRERTLLFFQDCLWFNYLYGENQAAAVLSTVETGEPAAPVDAAPTGITTDEPMAAIPPAEEIPAEAMIATEEPAIASVILPPAEKLPVANEPFIDEELEETPALQAEQTLIEPMAAGTIIPEVEEADAESPIEPPDAGAIIPSAEEPAKETEEEKETSILMPQLTITPVDTAAPLTFEPYHTIDYFASQGIRYKEEEKPKDRFDQQLKSFTEWLKTLKRLPETDTAPAPALVDDKKVTQLAEHSIEAREVVTEAMAEVWEKQGNAVKAIETYHKLSLLNPSKSSYFAAKIEHLKNT